MGSNFNEKVLQITTNLDQPLNKFFFMHVTKPVKIMFPFSPKCLSIKALCVDNIHWIYKKLHNITKSFIFPINQSMIKNEGERKKWKMKKAFLNKLSPKHIVQCLRYIEGNYQFP